MGNLENQNKLMQLALERCDELEENALQMTRELRHLQGMLQILLDQGGCENDGSEPSEAAPKKDG